MMVKHPYVILHRHICQRLADAATHVLARLQADAEVTPAITGGLEPVARYVHDKHGLKNPSDGHDITSLKHSLIGCRFLPLPRNVSTINQQPPINHQSTLFNHQSTTDQQNHQPSSPINPFTRLNSQGIQLPTTLTRAPSAPDAVDLAARGLEALVGVLRRDARGAAVLSGSTAVEGHCGDHGSWLVVNNG